MATERRKTPEELVVNCVSRLIQVIVVSHNCCPISAFKPVSISASSSSPSSTNTARYVYDTDIPNIKKFSTQYAEDYISRSWKYDPYTPFTLSIYLRESVESDNLVLIERWTFQCVRGVSNSGNSNMNNHASNDNVRALSRRIGILIRSLYCYVRLLPAFSRSTPSSTSMIFKLGTSTETKTNDGNMFLKNEFTFPKLPSSVVGFTIVKVSYMDPDDIKDAPRVQMEQIIKHTHAAIPSRLTMPMPIPSSSTSISSSVSRNPSSLPSQITMTTKRHHYYSTTTTGGGDGTTIDRHRNLLQRGDGTYLSDDTSDVINNHRSRSSDSAPLYLQEQFAPSSASPPFLFSNETLFSKTPDGNNNGGGYNISLSTSLIARQSRDNNIRNSGGDLSPIIPNLLSTSPQIHSIPPLDLSYIRTNNNNNNHNSNIINNDPYALRLSELPVSPFDIASSNNNIKRITNGTSNDNIKIRRSSKTSTKSDSMSNDELFDDDVVDDDNDADIDEGMFALDEDMPFVCDDDDDDGNDNDDTNTIPAQASNDNSKIHGQTFACSDKILNPPVLQLFSRDQKLQTQESDHDSQKETTNYTNNTPPNTQHIGPTSLIQQFKKFQLAFDTEEL